jgi:hypothetical protein
MSLQPATPNSEAAILSRLILAKDEMSCETARYFLPIDFSPSDVARMNLLAQRVREGTLSADEKTEIDSYLHVGNLPTILQSKARRHLNKPLHAPTGQ